MDFKARQHRVFPHQPPVLPGSLLHSPASLGSVQLEFCLPSLPSIQCMVVSTRSFFLSLQCLPPPYLFCPPDLAQAGVLDQSHRKELLVHPGNRLDPATDPAFLGLQSATKGFSLASPTRPAYVNTVLEERSHVPQGSLLSSTRLRYLRCLIT